MPKRGKKYRAGAAKVDRQQRYTIDEAISLVKEISFAKFDETVDISFNLGVDPKHADQMVRGAVTLPHGTGKTVRVLAFAKGEKETEAKEAGADFIGNEETVKEIQGGWLDFDRCVATPDMMGLVGRVGRILGPRGLMPNPKVGTVTFDVGKAVRDLKAGQVQFRVDRAGIVHGPVGKLSFDPDRLRENTEAFLDAIMRAKPAAAKGAYVKGITLTSTMGPGVKLDVNQVVAATR